MIKVYLRSIFANFHNDAHILEVNETDTILDIKLKLKSKFNSYNYITNNIEIFDMSNTGSYFANNVKMCDITNKDFKYTFII